MNLKDILISDFIKTILSGLLLTLVLCIFLPKQEAYGQRSFHDKRLKTAKQDKKKTRKKFFKMRDHEDVPKTNVKIRSTDPPKFDREPKVLVEPQNREKTQNYDFDERESLRPYRPEINYKGYRKAKRRDRNPNKTEADFRGYLKSSSQVLKPGRGVPRIKGEKGVSEQAAKRKQKARSREVQQYEGDLKYSSLTGKKGRNLNYNSGKTAKGKSKRSVERDYRAKSREVQQYAGDLKYSSLTGKKGRNLNYNSGKTAKGKSKRSVERDYRAKSRDIQQFSGNIKVSKAGKSKKGSYQGDMKVPSLSSKTRYFKKFSKKVNQFEGHIRIRRSDHKDMHPSVAYLKGKRKDSHKEKERLRKRKIFWFRLWRSSDQPKSVKQKPEKPKYDSRESEIWYD